MDTTSLWMKDIRLSRVGLPRDWDETGCVPKGWNLPLTNAYMLRATCYVTGGQRERSLSAVLHLQP